MRRRTADTRRNIRNDVSDASRRMVDFGLALIGDPKLIFLDEPTTGFDYSARRAAWEVITRPTPDLGKTIFLTTHYMEEAERLADRIAVIVDGCLVAEGTPQTLGGRDQAGAVISFTLPERISQTTTGPILGLRRGPQRQRGHVHVPTALNDLELLSMCAPRERRRAHRSGSNPTDARRHLPVAHEPQHKGVLTCSFSGSCVADARRTTSPGTPDRPPRGRSTEVGLVLHQFRYDLRSFLRDRASPASPPSRCRSCS